MSPETVKSAGELLFAIAVGRAKDHPREVAAGGLERYLESQMKIFAGAVEANPGIDSAGGMLRADDARF
jgi:hypothetical protein